LIRELVVKDSPLRRRLKGLRADKIMELAKHLGQCEFLNRENLIKLISIHCPERKRILIRYGCMLYYLSGALFKEAFPALHPGAAKLCMSRISESAESRIPDARSHETWMRIVEEWGISQSTLASLPLSEIMAIRRDSVGKEVRQTWRTLLENACNSHCSPDAISAFQRAAQKLIQLFEQEMTAQRLRQQRRKRMRTKIELGGWFTGLFSLGISGLAFALTLDPLISLAAAVPGGLLGRPVLDSLERGRGGTELVILAARLQGYASPRLK